MEKLFFYLKGLAIVNWAVTALKNLWPFLLIIIFWPEIDSFCVKYIPLWNEYMGQISGALTNGASMLRSLPVVSDIISFLGGFVSPVKQRLIEILR